MGKFIVSNRHYSTFPGGSAHCFKNPMIALLVIKDIFTYPSLYATDVGLTPIIVSRLFPVSKHRFLHAFGSIIHPYLNPHINLHPVLTYHLTPNNVPPTLDSPPYSTPIFATPTTPDPPSRHLHPTPQGHRHRPPMTSLLPDCYTTPICTACGGRLLLLQRIYNGSVMLSCRQGWTY